MLRLDLTAGKFEAKAEILSNVAVCSFDPLAAWEMTKDLIVRRHTQNSTERTRINLSVSIFVNSKFKTETNNATLEQKLKFFRSCLSAHFDLDEI